MKFIGSTLFTALVAGSSLLLSAPFTQACEESCRVGVSKAFADKYDEATNTIWASLKTKVLANIFNDVNFKQFLNQDNEKKK